jgi:hypothetical protein
MPLSRDLENRKRVKRIEGGRRPAPSLREQPDDRNVRGGQERLEREETLSPEAAGPERGLGHRRIDRPDVRVRHTPSSLPVEAVEGGVVRRPRPWRDAGRRHAGVPEVAVNVVGEVGGAPQERRPKDHGAQDEKLRSPCG